MKLLSFGEVLFDCIGNEKNLGGAPLNLAVHSALQGVDSYIYSAVGDDELGCVAHEKLKAFGVKCDYVTTLRGEVTGRCDVTLTGSGVPYYNLLQNCAYDKIPYKKLDEDFDVLAFGTLALRESANRETLEKILSENAFREVFVDLNIRAPFYNPDTINFALSHSTILKISNEELPIVTSAIFDKVVPARMAMKLFKEKYPNLKICLISLGSDGACCMNYENNKFIFYPAVITKVKSTVGAGDSFSATFISQYFKGKGIDTALRLAVSVSGFVVSHDGAIPSCMAEFYSKNIK